jgi:plasmid stabilization system protein ParE
MKIQLGLRRIEDGEHVIFYRPQFESMLVSRVIHRSKRPQRHPMDEEL